MLSGLAAVGATVNQSPRAAHASQSVCGAPLKLDAELTIYAGSAGRADDQIAGMRSSRISGLQPGVLRQLQIQMLRAPCLRDFRIVAVDRG
jgi:hypothetical protein